MSTSVDDAAIDSDPIEYFLQDLEYHGKSERTLESYERVLRRFETFVSGSQDAADELGELSSRDCMEWIHTLRSDHAESTVATYASYLHRFYSYMTQVGAFTENPMTIVVEQMDERIDSDPTRRDLTVPDMRAFVGEITNPFDRTLVVTLLKTGLRVGELCNLDRRDLHLPIDEIDAPRNVHPHLQGKPYTLLASPEPTKGEEYNDCVRSASNKRKRPSVIPVDDELARILKRWLAVRPDPRSQGDPLFPSTSTWGKRVTPDMVHHVVERHARDAGWYRTGGGVTENVTPHYFRHFFTTHLRANIGSSGVVQYLRGDVAAETVDTYTHNWGSLVRDEYETHIYSVL